jgi:hypothetical protein
MLTTQNATEVKEICRCYAETQIQTEESLELMYLLSKRQTKMQIGDD